MSRTWVVVPMYNEASVVGDVVTELLCEFNHVVCIDDGSNDGSPAIARAAGATVVEHPVNLGQGAALQTGLHFALRDPATTEIVTFDADGQHLVTDAKAMVARIQSGEAEVVLGSRFLDHRTKVSPLKRFVLRVAATQSRWATGMALTDAHNGLRAFNAATAARIYLTQNRMAHASELVRQLSEIQPRWVEHPVKIIYTDYSKAKGQSLLNSVNILTDLLFR